MEEMEVIHQELFNYKKMKNYMYMLVDKEVMQLSEKIHQRVSMEEDSELGIIQMMMQQELVAERLIYD